MSLLRSTNDEIGVGGAAQLFSTRGSHNLTLSTVRTLFVLVTGLYIGSTFRSYSRKSAMPDEWAVASAVGGRSMDELQAQSGCIWVVRLQMLSCGPHVGAPDPSSFFPFCAAWLLLEVKQFVPLAVSPAPGSCNHASRSTNGRQLTETSRQGYSMGKTNRPQTPGRD